MTVDSSQLSEVLPRVERLPHTRLSLAISQALQTMANAVSWVWLVLMATIVLNVTMRYAFGEGRVEFEEIQWHLYAVGFLLSLSACLDSDSHVRVDLFHERCSRRTQAWIELYGLLLLFFPFIAMVLIFTLPFIQYSFSISEVSDSPGGLPYRWVIKSFLAIGMALLLVAGFGRLLRVSAELFGTPQSIDTRRQADVD